MLFKSLIVGVTSLFLGNVSKRFLEIRFETVWNVSNRFWKCTIFGNVSKRFEAFWIVFPGNVSKRFLKTRKIKNFKQNFPSYFYTWKPSIAKFQPRKPLLHRAKMHGAQLELHISKQYHKSVHFRTLKIHKKTSASQPCSIFENVSTVEMHENCHD